MPIGRRHNISMPIRSLRVDLWLCSARERHNAEDVEVTRDFVIAYRVSMVLGGDVAAS